MPIEAKVALFVLGVTAVAFWLLLGWIVREFPGGPPPINNKKCAACNRWFAMVEQSGNLVREDNKFGIPLYSVQYRCRWCGALVMQVQQKKPRSSLIRDAEISRGTDGEPSDERESPS